MGSLRNPAGWCNVYGYRPSVNRVPDPGFDVYTGYFATSGPMARTVADVALLLGTQSGHMPAAPLSRADDPRLKELTPDNVLDKLRKDPKGVRIGWLGNWDGHLAMEKGILETTEKTLKSLETIGVKVDMIKPFYDPKKFWEQIWLPIRHYSACAMNVHVQAGKRDLLKPEAQFEYDGSTKMSAQDVYNAFLNATAYYNAMMKTYEEYDFLAVPTAQVFPFDKTIHWPKEIEGRQMKTYHNWMEVVTHWTIGGNAVVAAPAGFGGANNLPIGIQFIAKPGCDFELLQFAKAYEELNDFVGKNYPTELEK
jgi:amidase